MHIVIVRRICQGFFLILFLWLCVAMNLGDRWFQLRGWPVNWILQLDPLVGLGTLLATGTLYRGLLWGLATVVLTIFLGRFFCGWLCPMGTLHHLIGHLAHGKKPPKVRAALNRYRKGQAVKYGILIVLLASATVDIVNRLLVVPAQEPAVFWGVALAGLLGIGIMAWRQVLPNLKKTMALPVACLVLWAVAAQVFHTGPTSAASLQTGLLDPIALMHRSVNLVVLPLVDGSAQVLSAHPRYYGGSGLIGGIFLAALLLNLHIPRFYCRFVCPLGALFGVLSRYTLWRMGKSRTGCVNCLLCETGCEGACVPSAQIRTAECVLCMNCLNTCRNSTMGFRRVPSAAGEMPHPDISRRQVLVCLASGLVGIPVLRLNGGLGPAWQPGLVRPPGALAEAAFLHRCIKCGQCMRICPTNVIQPAGISTGLEGLWTPVLNFRIGTSGCQLNCIACGHVCPTAAIRPLSLSKKLGTGAHAEKGPIRIGTAFVDRGRCLPWAMNTPCIVCQENCPVSPKAITTLERFETVTTPLLTVAQADATRVRFTEKVLDPDRFGTGDYHLSVEGRSAQRSGLVLTNTRQTINMPAEQTLDPPPEPGDRVTLLIRLQLPAVDPVKCIGCGICQHECPVKGKRAIRVTADNETRDSRHALTLTQMTGNKTHN